MSILAFFYTLSVVNSDGPQLDITVSNNSFQYHHHQTEKYFVMFIDHCDH